jgi:hypothetical protein
VPPAGSESFSGDTAIAARHSESIREQAGRLYISSVISIDLHRFGGFSDDLAVQRCYP